MKTSVLKSLKSYAIITFGLFINTLGWTAFLLPSQIVGGGISGVSSLLYFSTGISVGIPYLIINLFLIILAIKILGAQFGIKTVYGIITVSVFLSGLQMLIKKPVVHEPFMAAIIGGILAGAGIGIVFTQGGSSGGTDIIALIVNKYKDISPGKIILFIDIIIIASSFFIFHSIEKIVYGYVTMAVTSYSIDLILEGSKQSVQVFVFTKRPDPIAEEIGTRLNRGVTLLHGTGWYTKTDVTVLLVVARKYEIQSLLRIIQQIDQNSFISVGNVMGVYGKGFERIRL